VGKWLARQALRPHPPYSVEFTGGQTTMISALGIGFALSASLLAAVHALRNQPKPRPVPVRVRDRRDPRG
jgi:hypothetical protein